MQTNDDDTVVCDCCVRDVRKHERRAAWAEPRKAQRRPGIRPGGFVGRTERKSIASLAASKRRAEAAAEVPAFRRLLSSKGAIRRHMRRGGSLLRVVPRLWRYAALVAGGGR